MDIQEILAMTPSELEHHGVKGQKWGVKRNLKKVGPAVSKAATATRAFNNELSHPFKSAAAKVEGHNTKTHESRKKFNANIDKQKEESRLKSRARILKLASNSGKAFNAASKIAYNVNSDVAMMKLHARYPDLYANPLRK